MGTGAHVIVVGGPAGLTEHARRRIDHLEGLWSRFLPESEVSRLNGCAGSFIELSAETLLLLERALEGWRLSGGAFDAMVLAAVVAAGYDRSFNELGADEEGSIGPMATAAAAASATMDGPPLVIRARTACVREGVGFDAGGIGKGLAADLVVAELLELGASGACVNLGGDLRLAGDSPAGSGWTIGIEHSWSPTPLALVGIREGAVATSTTLKRRWRAGAEWHHHLIDPRSGLPSDSDLNHVTVVAAEGWAAEVLAKAVLLNGSEFAFNIVGGTGAEALAVDETGHVMASDGFAAFLGGAELPTAVPGPLVPSAPRQL